MKSFSKKISAGCAIIILALSIGLGSLYFLIDQEKIVEDEAILVEVRARVLKEDGLGGWTPIETPGEVIPGNINFECNITNYDYIKDNSLRIDSVEFYLSNSIPDLQNPNPEDWSMITSFNEDMSYYYYIIDGHTLPDDIWYFISRVIDNENISTYDTYNISDMLMQFSIEHFDDSITFIYLDIDGRINYNSHIAVVPLGDFGQYIVGVDLFIVPSWSGIPELLTITPINYSDIVTNSNLLDLDMISSWIVLKNLTLSEYNVSFIITLHLNYGEQFPVYHYNYNLAPITLDIKGPDITLIELSLQLGMTYWNVEDFILSALINSTTTDLMAVTLYYMYDLCYPGGDWVTYGTFTGQTPVDITFNILHLRDDKIHLRFTAYDDLGNANSLEGSNYWIVKDFNDHLDFGLEGIDNNYIYSLSNGMIDLRVDVYPYDNDITKAAVRTDYEYIELTNVNVEGDHIKFTEVGDVDIKLDPVFYNVFGSIFSHIPIDVILYQGSTYITSKRITIIATDITFQEKVNISGIEIDPNITQSDNIWMSFSTGTDSYKNSHEIPYIINRNPPVIKIFNSQDILVETVTLSPDYNDVGYKNYDQEWIKIQNNVFNLSLTGLGELCTVDAISINGSYYDFNYFIQNSTVVYIKLLTATNLDGIYGFSGPISMNYTISNMIHLTSQYKASFNFQSLSSDNYTIVGEFYDISGRISTFTINKTSYIDFAVSVPKPNKR